MIRSLEAAATWKRSRCSATPWSIPSAGISSKQTEPILKIPREDDEAADDQQGAFIWSRDRVAICSGGNASGKTEAAAFHVAQYLLNWQKPPRRDTPFWIISDSYEQVCGVCWQEKLSKYIPAELIDWERTFVVSPQSQLAILGPAAAACGPSQHELGFGVQELRAGAREDAGAVDWRLLVSEQFPWEIFVEVLRGCRDYMYRGGQICEFTPVDPAKSVELAEITGNGSGTRTSDRAGISTG